jgi:hypothetical protein
MSIGFAAEDYAHEALLRGLSRRWGLEASLHKIPCRGSGRPGLTRDLRQGEICFTAQEKGYDTVAVLVDADRRPWNEVRTEMSARVSPFFQSVGALVGVCDRNVECWLAADPDYLARRLEINADELRVDDPKGVVQAAIRAKRIRVEELVEAAPVGRWIDSSPSFEAFYDDARTLGQRKGCDVPNEREPGDTR